ncbi:MAG: hypothetical protein M3P32_09525 [Chloroflexota bacterium]|nr:hypothetical protein [Chloroflexota bacterium]
MAPAWAERLVEEVCTAAAVPSPLLRWRRTRRSSSSGATRVEAGTISVTAGTDELDQRLTLLHELAHWLGPRSRRRRRRIIHHDAAFFTTAFELYRRHGIPDAAALEREGGRHPSALRHARGLGVPGADVAWREHRDALRERARQRRPPRVLVAEHTVRLVRDGRWTRCAVCGVRLVGPTLARLRRRSGRHTLLAVG